MPVCRESNSPRSRPVPDTCSATGFHRCRRCPLHPGPTLPARQPVRSQPAPRPGAQTAAPQPGKCGSRFDRKSVRFSASCRVPCPLPNGGGPSAPIGQGKERAIRTPLSHQGLARTDVSNFRDFLNGGENQPGWDLNRYLSIRRRLILESRVEVDSPSLAAAPCGPDTRPRLWASAASMASFSWASNMPLRATPE